MEVNADIKEHNQKPAEATTIAVQDMNSNEYMKARSKFIKWKAIEEMDKILLSFETNFTNNGGKVIWADSPEEVFESIQRIATYKNTKHLLSNNAPILEEINFSTLCKEQNISHTPLDLNGYLNHLDKNTSRPIDYRTQDDIKTILSKGDNADNLISSLKDSHTKYLKDHPICISGASFVSGDGAIVCNDNDGINQNTLSNSNTIIYIIGIEKVIYSVQDLSILWPSIAEHTTEKSLHTYNSLNFGPQNKKGFNGPKESYVILLDNGRSKLLEDPKEREALYDIIYQTNISASGSYSNNASKKYYLGDQIGRNTLIFNELSNNNQFRNLNYVSLLYTQKPSATDIDINKLVLYSKHKEPTDKTLTQKEKWSLYIYKNSLLNHKRLNLFNPSIKNFILSFLVKDNTCNLKDLPKFNSPSFQLKWTEQFK